VIQLVINIFILFIFILIFNKFKKLNEIYDDLKLLISKFIDINQTFYKNQNEIIEQLMEFDKKFFNNINNIKSCINTLEKISHQNALTTTKYENLIKLMEFNSKTIKENNNSLKNKIELIKNKR